MKKEILKHVLHFMHERNISLTKIAIQKMVYFLREAGVPLKYKYEPYIYGPYSSELKSDLKNLALWDELSINGNNYYLRSNFKLNTSIDKECSDLISNQIDKFSNAIDNDFSFDSMEISGTIIYCYQALKNVGMQPDENNVLNEFKNWKGERYSDTIIKKAYAKISPLLN